MQWLDDKGKFGVSTREVVTPFIEKGFKPEVVCLQPNSEFPDHVVVLTHLERNIHKYLPLELHVINFPKIKEVCVCPGYTHSITKMRIVTPKLRSWIIKHKSKNKFMKLRQIKKEMYHCFVHLRKTMLNDELKHYVASMAIPSRWRGKNVPTHVEELFVIRQPKKWYESNAWTFMNQLLENMFVGGYYVQSNNDLLFLTKNNSLFIWFETCRRVFNLMLKVTEYEK